MTRNHAIHVNNLHRSVYFHNADGALVCAVLTPAPTFTSLRVSKVTSEMAHYLVTAQLWISWMNYIKCLNFSNVYIKPVFAMFRVNVYWLGVLRSLI